MGEERGEERRREKEGVKDCTKALIYKAKHIFLSVCKFVITTSMASCTIIQCMQAKQLLGIMYIHVSDVSLLVLGSL